MSKYWETRMLEIEASNRVITDESIANLETAYREVERQLSKEIEIWYNRLAENNEVSVADMRKLLTKNELAEFKWTVEEYIKYGQENALDGRWMKQLENAAGRFEISRRQARMIEIQQAAEIITSKRLEITADAMRDVYENTYYRTMFTGQQEINVGWNIAKIDNQRLQKVLERPWAPDGRTFSDRIWSDKTRLINTMQTGLIQSVMDGGKSSGELIKQIAEIEGRSLGEAARVVRTETAWIASLANQEGFIELGAEKYQILATLDIKTSEVCQDMDGRIFDMKDYEVGDTAPPFHPNCRTQAIPYFDDMPGERAARDENGKTIYIPDDMTYKEWKAKFIDKSEDKWYNEFKDKVHADILNNYPLTIHRGRQDKHIVGTNNYKEGNSILTADPDELIKLYAGKSRPIPDSKGEWTERERFVHTDYIGKYLTKKGDSFDTKVGLIHYSKKGVHIVPAKPNGRDIELTLTDI
jgi:phage putative head morphogenesis protein, SPP1 gp7 family